MPNLALVKAIAVALILAATFAFGWSTGSEHVQAQWDRERAELNAQAAKAIEEANSRVRKAEQAASYRVAQSEKLYLTKLKENPMKKVLLLIALALAGCSSTPSVRVVSTPCPTLPSLPAVVMEKRESNFLERLENFLSGSPQKPTASPNN